MQGRLLRNSPCDQDHARDCKRTALRNPNCAADWAVHSVLDAKEALEAI